MSGSLAATLAELPWPDGPGLVVLAGALLATLLCGWVLGRLSRSSTLPRAVADADRLAELERALAAAWAEADRRAQQTEATTAALCAAITPALGALSEAAEQTRGNGAEAAAQAARITGELADNAARAADAAAQLALFAGRGQALAQSLSRIAGALAAVAEAIGPPEHAPEHAPGHAPAGGESLVQLTGEASFALAVLAAGLEATGRSTAALVERFGATRAAAEDNAAAVQAVGIAAAGVSQAAMSVGLELATFLDQLARVGDRRRHDRYPTDLDAQLVAGGRTRPVRVVDISRGGVAVAGDPGLAKASEAVLHLPGIEPLTVRVAQALGERTGLQFVADDPLAGRLEALIVETRAAA